MVIRKRSPKWRRQPADRPSQILKAALLVFGEAGVTDATLDQVASRAGVSKGTIYLYFASKEDLFRQTIRHALPAAPTEPAAQPSGTASRQLRDTLSRQWHFLTSESGLTLSRLVAAEQWQFPDLAELYAEHVVSRFVEELAWPIRRGTATGEFRDIDPLVAARMLAALAVQSALWQGAGGSGAAAGKSSAVVLRELTEFYLQAIAQSDSAFPQADGASDLRGALNS